MINERRGVVLQYELVGRLQGVVRGAAGAALRMQVELWGLEQVLGEESRAEQSRAEQSRAMQCRAMQSNAEQCRAMQSNAAESCGGLTRAQEERREQKETYF